MLILVLNKSLKFSIYFYIFFVSDRITDFILFKLGASFLSSPYIIFVWIGVYHEACYFPVDEVEYAKRSKINNLLFVSILVDLTYPPNVWKTFQFKLIPALVNPKSIAFLLGEEIKVITNNIINKSWLSLPYTRTQGLNTIKFINIHQRATPTGFTAAPFTPEYIT